MSYRTWYSPVTGHKRRIHWNSWFAGHLGGANNCVTLNATDILSTDEDINAETLCHEDGHAITAEKRGLLYLPWVIWAFVFDGYERSKAEREAEAHRAQYQHLYANGLRKDA